MRSYDNNSSISSGRWNGLHARRQIASSSCY